jgi:phosphatidate cytidylyltransferase
LNSNLVTRLLTGLIAIPLLLWLLFGGPAWGWMAFVSVACAVGSLELFGMTHPGDRVSQALGVLLSVGVIQVLWFFGSDVRYVLAAFLLLPLLGLFFTLARLGDIETSARRALAMAFGPAYVGGGLASVILLRRDAGDVDNAGAGFVTLVLILSWASDTGAYFAGRFLGKHKLFPAVSPKKTVEGALGGLAGAALGAAVACSTFLPSLPLVHGLLLAVIAGGLGQAGDLGESMIKRSYGVKDSGGIVPGHGGILDRVDATLVVGVLTYLYVLFVRGV